MPQISFHLHPDLASVLLAQGQDGRAAIASAARQATAIIQAHGRRIAYAPIILPGGLACAMSIYLNGFGAIVVEIDAPGTALPGRGIVTDWPSGVHLPVRRKEWSRR